MSNLYIMEAANLFAGDHNPQSSNHLTLQNLKLPGLEEQFTDHAAGGAPVAIEIDTHIGRLEATFNLLGWQPRVMTLIGQSARNRQTFTAYGLIRNRRTGEPMEGMAVMQGRLGRVNPTDFNRGTNQVHEYAIRSIVHYELKMGGEQIYFWDFFTNVRRVGGEDLNFDLNRILRIPTGAA
jgi:hypothetical protein